MLGFDGGFARWRSRVSGKPEFGGELPVAVLAEEIEAAGEGQIRALITSAGNPVLSTPGGPRLERALGTLDFMVSIDPYLNETTRLAHVILPPTSPLERSHYDAALNAFAVRNVAKYSEPVVPRKASERLDWEIVAELAGRIFVPRPLRRLALLAARRLSPERILDALLRAGPHRLSLAKLRRFPHGMDLGPLEPGRFRDRIAPEDFLREARAELFVEADRETTGELLLIGRRQLRDNNSWMHNSRRLVKGPPRCTLLVHPVDAALRNLATGHLAQLRSDTGTVVVPVEVTDTMLAGVVSLPHGWGHDRDGTRLGVAREHAGVSVNDVTSDVHLDTLSGNAGFNGLAVTVQRVDAPKRAH
jgi:anaerobic selenocysteine-containing dehydrogenase